MAEAAVRQASYADLEAVSEHRVAEIIDGVPETHPRPRPQQGIAAARLSGELNRPFARGRDGPGGPVFFIEPELHLRSQVVVPDLAVWRRARMPTDPQDTVIENAPDMVCEIVSPSTTRLDRGPKRRIYGDAGIGHLRLLDPAAGVLEGFGLADGRWVLPATIQRGETVELPPIDAVPFPLDDHFPFDDPAAPAFPET